MEKRKQLKYMNPITFEAEMFLINLENLSKTHNHFDTVLLSSLEKIMSTIETFLDSNSREILATENTKLVACGNLNHIKRIYHCSRCKTDLGKSVENATLHLIEKCAALDVCKGAAAATGGDCSKTNHVNEDKNRDRKSNRSELRKEKKFIRQEKLLMQQEKRINLAVELTKKTRSLLTTDFNQFADHLLIAKKLKRIPEYDVIKRDLKALITHLFPGKNVSIYKFGSRLAGIGSRESDLDLFIDIGDTFNVFQNRADNESLNKLYTVEKALVSNHKLWYSVVKIDKARVPILKAIHVPTKIECDINFSNGLGSINTKLMDYLFDLQPIARFLCVFMKKWLKRTSLNTEVNTYSMNLMVIFYLQTQELLPSLEKLQVNVNQNKVGPWLCSYATLTLEDLNIPLEDIESPNMLKFIREFLIFYTNYDFDKDVVCPYLGKPIKKVDVEKLMPERYTEYSEKNPDYVLELDKAIVVQDPIQLNHNVTKRLSTFNLQVFIMYLVKSLEVINKTFLF